MMYWQPIILGALAEWMFNPSLFALGAVAVAVPIVIHLLNKRKFQVVEWAAMDFLLDADKKNRRRIRLENLLLLLLRCAAVFLIGLLLARPIMPTSVTAGLIDAAQFERIVVLDDSLSMQARQGNESVWESARKRVVDLTRSLAEEGSENSLTLLLTSQPDEPVLNGMHLGPATVDDLVTTIEQLEPGDSVADLPATLRELEANLAAQPANVNRVVYFFSDLRERDWKAADTSAEGILQGVERVAQLANSCYVVNVAEPEDRNLTVVEIRPENTLVEGVLSRFDVVVANQGSTEAKDIRVKFTAGDALPLQQEIERLGAGQSTTVPFSFTFTDEQGAAEGDAPLKLAPRQVKVEIQTAQQGEDDRLPADSVAYFPARLVRGIPALVVDGDPSATFGRAESFYLRRSLAPQGPVASGVAAEIVTETELESLTLDKYQVIFLCNVYRLGDKTLDNLQKLERWVENGGGLVLLPGDQIDEHFFNEHYYRDGQGLSPLKLENIRGDETEASWVNFRIEQSNHPVLKVFDGQNNPFLDNVKTFRWWASSVAKEQLGSSVAVTARFSDVDETPALAEKRVGKGRVLAAAFPVDADWSNWPSDPSYLIAMQEIVRYMSGNRGARGTVRVGEPLRHPIDLTQYELDGALTGPNEREVNLQAAADSPENDGSADAGGKGGNEDGQRTETSDQPEAVWHFDYDATHAQGFYNLTLRRRDGGAEPVLFAANVDPAEGDLKHVDVNLMKRNLGDANVQILNPDEAGLFASDSTQTELWWYLLWSVVSLLCTEQVLGWWFGRSR